jgi:nickel transport protein
MKKISLRHRILLVCVMMLLTFGFTSKAYANGVVITYSLRANGEVELLAEFDTGEPMAEAQVTIYSPADPLTSWLSGTADAEGHYSFVIDPAIPGSWDIQFRKAGHGDIVHLQLEAGMIDPAMMDQAPGELLPDTPAAKTIAAEAASSAGPETDAAAVEEKSALAERGADTTGQTTANDIDLTGIESAIEAAEPNSAATAVAEGKETRAEQMETETATVTEAEPVVQPEPVAQAEIDSEVGPAAAETAAQVAPRSANVAEEPDQVAVLSSGGNTATTGGFTSFQILLMSGSIIWGFVGTALYFSGKKNQDHSHRHGHHH